jgi:hypothetical protein
MADIQRAIDLLTQAYALPASASCLALLEEAMRLADAHQNVDLGFHAREMLMDVARSLLRGDIQATAFAWCLAQYDREPQRFSHWQIFHRYSSIIGQMANQCDVSRTRVEEMLTDLGRRLELAGYSRRYVHFTEQFIAPDLGDRELARSATLALGRLPTDALSAGAEWELGAEVETELFLGRPQRALELAKPFLDDRARHWSKADDICAGLLWPLWQRGEKERARALQKRCMRSYEPGRVYYWWFGHMLTFAAHTDLGAAVKRYAECQRAIHEFSDPLTRLHFGADALVVFQRLLAAGQETIAVRLPNYVPVARDDGRYSVRALHDWLAGPTRELADRFDARNGTTYWKDVGLKRSFSESE